MRMLTSEEHVGRVVVDMEMTVVVMVKIAVAVEETEAAVMVV